MADSCVRAAWLASKSLPFSGLSCYRPDAQMAGLSEMDAKVQKANGTLGHQTLTRFGLPATSGRDVLLRRLVSLTRHLLAGKNNAISVRLVRHMGL